MRPLSSLQIRIVSATVIAVALIALVVQPIRPSAIKTPTVALKAPPSPPKAATLLNAPPPLTEEPLTEAVKDMIRQASDASPNDKGTVANQLAALGEGAIEDLGAALRAAPTLAARRIIAQALAKIGTSEAVDQIIAGLRGIPDPTQQAELIQAFATLSTPGSIETLTSSMASVEDPQLANSLAEMIGTLASNDTVRFLTEMYREAPSIPAQPDNVVAALTAIHNPAATSALSELATTAPELSLQYAAARSLGVIGTPNALEGLVSTAFRVGNTNPELRQAILNSLASAANPEAKAWLQQQSHSPTLPQDITAALAKALSGLRK